MLLFLFKLPKQEVSFTINFIQNDQKVHEESPKIKLKLPLPNSSFRLTLLNYIIIPIDFPSKPSPFSPPTHLFPPPIPESPLLPLLLLPLGH